MEDEHLYKYAPSTKKSFRFQFKVTEITNTSSYEYQDRMIPLSLSFNYFHGNNCTQK